jgi:NADP-reducing hydrogenase subunit HndC
MLEKITKGQGSLELLDEMEALCHYIKANSLCGLGQTAPNPVLSTLHFFRDEYVAHVVDKKCPAGVCKDLLEYTIIKDSCMGCSLCSRKCPVGAISQGDSQYNIAADTCIDCGTCAGVCPTGAISQG